MSKVLVELVEAFLVDLEGQEYGNELDEIVDYYEVKFKEWIQEKSNANL